jgi:hypothetical protein
METPITNKVSILSNLWIEYRSDEEFEDFIDYNDIALPLAYAIQYDIVTITPKAQMFIEETWELLLGALDIGEDTGFDSLEDMFMLGSGE